METNREILSGQICPYCGAKSEYVDSSVIYGKSYGMIYLCRPCDAYVGVHKERPTEALGRLANKDLREWKKKAHAAFDPIWKNKIMKRYHAYTWLSEQLGIERDLTHIGMFGIEECIQAFQACEKFRPLLLASHDKDNDLIIVEKG